MTDPFTNDRADTNTDRDALAMYDWADEIEARVQGWQSAIWAVTHEQLSLATQVLGDDGTHVAVRTLFNQAVNDLNDLLTDLREGSGRSAMRASRSIVEHAINLHTVAASLRNAERYIDHLHQGRAIAFEMQIGANRLRKVPRQAYLHALRKVGGGARARFEAAVATHGTWFRRTWADRNIADRATDAGLDDLYRFYKLASLVTHGSAGGSLGSVKDHPEGYSIYRTGPALELAPVAMWGGIAGYREVLAALGTVREDIDIPLYTEALDHLDSMWADYFTALGTMDRALWPTERVASPMGYVAIARDGTCRWFLHQPMAAALVPATEPTLSDDMREGLANLINKVTGEQENFFPEDVRFVLASIEDTTLAPDTSKPWIPETAFGGIERTEEGEVIVIPLGPKT